MSERFLFRGKTDPMREGEPSYWAVGWYYEGSNGETLIQKKDCESEVYVIASTVGQCTGLRDKNGILIFEKDILGGGVDGDRREYLVQWNYDHACFLSVEGPKRVNKISLDFLPYVAMSNMRLDKVEVIGNIHDTPLGDLSL